MGVRKVDGHGPEKPLSPARTVTRKLLENADLTGLAALGLIRYLWNANRSHSLRGKVTQRKGNPSTVARSDKMRSCITNKSFISMVAHMLGLLKKK